MQHRRRTLGNMHAGVALICLALAGCNKTPQGAQPVSGAPIAALQLATAAPPPPTYAPPAPALPQAQPVAYRPSPEHWRYLTDAYDMSDAFADTPPDYTVDYEGEDPYVWRADDGAYRVVEWLPDGARYYYYEPGADEPFLIQDPEYSYAYDDGALVGVYTLAGALVAEQIADQRRGYAARYYARGHDLYRAAVNDRRRAAYAGDWQNRAPMIEAQRTRWQQGRQEQPGWRDWSQAHQAQQEARWAPERQHRLAYAAALGTAGVAGAYAIHRHNQQAADHANVRPAPQPPVDAGPHPGAFPDHARPDAAERHAEAVRAQPGLLRDSTPAPPARGAHPAMADRHEPDMRRGTAAPGHSPMGQARQVQQVQHREMAQAAQAQRHEVQQAQRAQHAEMAQAQHAERQQEAQAEHARMTQAQHAQHAAMQAQRMQARAEPHATPAPHAQAPRPQPSHVETPHPQAPHPAAQPHGNGGGHTGDHRHH